MSMDLLWWGIFITLGFFGGSIMFCKLLAEWLCGKDICRLSDDGNPGAANLFIHCGVGAGMLGLALDMLKGFLPVFLAYRHFGVSDPAFAVVMMAPVLGHAIAPLNHFKGGKCIATSFGVLIALLPTTRIGLVLAAVYILFSTIVKIQPNSRRSIFAFSIFLFISLPVLLYKHMAAVAFGCAMISLTAIYKHVIAERHSESLIEKISDSEKENVEAEAGSTAK